MTRYPRKFRVRYVKKGAHYHCRIFSSTTGETWGLLGSIVMDEHDWESFNTQVHQTWQFLPEDGS